MLRRFVSLFLLLFAISVSTLVAKLHGAPIPSHSFLCDANAEAAFACGQKISFAQSGVYELQLIPGIAERLTKELLSASADIKARADTLATSEQYHALESARGIGPKTSKGLGHYLRFSASSVAPTPYR